VGVQELILVGVVLVVLLAVPARFPHLARSVGEGLREFRRIGKDTDEGRQ
jgi:Sec-independent protein translocase protein TatA